MGINCSLNYRSSKIWQHYVSMELFTECAVSLLYSINYYQLFIFELSSKTIPSLIINICTFINMNHMKSIFRVPSFYFYKTQSYCTKNNDNHYWNTIWRKVLSLLLNIFEDESSFNEWRIRHSIDLCVRCISLICAFCLVVIELCVISYQEFLVSQKSDYNYNLGIFYCGFFFSCDLIYFGCVFLFNCYWKNYFNILNPLIMMYKANSKVLVCMFCTSLLFALFVGLINFNIKIN